MEGCKDLDGLASCGIIRVEHLFHLEIDQRQLIGLAFFIGPLTPMSPRWKTKTGAALGKSQDNARFDLRGYSVVVLV